MVHAELCGGLSEALSAGGEESTEEAAGFEFLEPGLPALGGGAEAIEDPVSSAEITALPSRKSRPV